MRRPQLRQWFDRTDEYDEVIFWRLDRFVRRTFPDWADMVSWAAANQISLVSATEELDLSGPLQRLMATMFATVGGDGIGQHGPPGRRVPRVPAPDEAVGRRPPAIRIQDHHQSGRPGQGACRQRANSWQVAREAVRRVIAGESVNSVATDFNKRGIAPPLAKIWAGDTGLRQSCATRPCSVTSCTTARQCSATTACRSCRPSRSSPTPNGMPCSGRWRSQPHPGAQRHAQHAAQRGSVRQVRRPAVPVHQAQHRHPSQRRTAKTRPVHLLPVQEPSAAASRPKTCDAKMINCKELNAWVDLWFTGEAFGYHEIIEQVTVPGANQDAQIAAINQAIKDLTAQYTQEVISDAEYDGKFASLRAERRRLQAMPAEPDQIIERATGVTVAEHWKTLDAAEKRRYLLAARVVVHAGRDERGRLEARLTGESPYPRHRRAETTQVEAQSGPTRGATHRTSSTELHPHLMIGPCLLPRTMATSQASRPALRGPVIGRCTKREPLWSAACKERRILFIILDEWLDCSSM